MAKDDDKQAPGLTNVRAADPNQSRLAPVPDDDGPPPEYYEQFRGTWQDESLPLSQRIELSNDLHTLKRVLAGHFKKSR